MLKAGASTSDKSATDLLTADAKSFNMGDYTTRIAQVNTVDIDEVFDFASAVNKSVADLSEVEAPALSISRP